MWTEGCWVRVKAVQYYRNASGSAVATRRVEVKLGRPMWTATMLGRAASAGQLSGCSALDPAIGENGTGLLAKGWQSPPGSIAEAIASENPCWFAAILEAVRVCFGAEVWRRRGSADPPAPAVAAVVSTPGSRRHMRFVRRAGHRGVRVARRGHTCSGQPCLMSHVSPSRALLRSLRA
jgi:hypothetical protein